MGVSSQVWLLPRCDQRMHNRQKQGIKVLVIELHTETEVRVVTKSWDLGTGIMYSEHSICLQKRDKGQPKKSQGYPH